MHRRLVTTTLPAVACLLAISAAPCAAQAAAIPNRALSLDDVLELALARSEPVAIARADIDRAKGEQRRARSGLLPQLDATATYSRALASEFEGLFDSSGPPCAPFAPDPAADLAARVTEIERAAGCGSLGSSIFGSGGSDVSTLPFGRRNTWTVNLSLSQNIFSGGRIGAQQQLAGAGRDLADLTLKSTTAQFLLQTTTAYYDAALSTRLVAIAEATVRQSDATLKQVQAAFDVGNQPEFELLRARVNRDNQSPVLIRQRANREIAYLRLKQLLELPPGYNLELADALGDPALPTPAVLAPRLAAAVSIAEAARLETSPTDADASADRAVVQQASAAVLQREAALHAAEAERMPSAALTSAYGRVAYPGNLFPSFGDFRTNWTVGATVHVPILTGGALRASRDIAQAQLEQSRIQLRQTRELTEVDSRSAFAELRAAQAAWEASGGTIQQATRAYEIAEVRYRSGVSTQLELSDSRLLLAQAGANRAEAAHELQVARARMALLPDLPLGTIQGSAPSLPQLPASPQTPSSPSGQPGTGQLRKASLSTTPTTAGPPGGPR